MMDEKQKQFLKALQEEEQACSNMGNLLSNLLWSLFSRLKERGFTEEHAFALVQTYLYAYTSNGFRTLSVEGRPEDEKEE